MFNDSNKRELSIGYPGSWHNEASCTDNDLFTLDKLSRKEREQLHDICKQCPVAVQCLVAAANEELQTPNPVELPYLRGGLNGAKLAKALRAIHRAKNKEGVAKKIIEKQL